MRSKILWFLWFMLWNFAKASFPEDVNPLRINFYRKHYLAFTGLAAEFDPERIKMDIQRILIAKRTLYITARDNIYSIELDRAHTNAIYYSKRLSWQPSNKQQEKCQRFGRKEEECHNYIKVLVQKDDRQLLICGTNAFEPTCRHHEVDSLAYRGEPFSGRGTCPFDVKVRNIALFAGGSLYTGTPIDFRGTKPVFQRTLGNLPTLQTVSQDFNWLYDPHFIHAVEYGNYIYLFFHELSLEFKITGKVILPRVARVCKNDRGGKLVLQKQWTSFLKARMICSVHGDIPFYFNVLRSMTNIVKINSRDMVVGVFTTPINSIPGSAVCAFDMQDVERAFAGSFKTQKDYNTVWIPVNEEDVPKPRPGSCAGSAPFEKYKSSIEFPNKVLTFMRMHTLMNEAVSSTFTKPWFQMTAPRYYLTNIVLDTSAGPKKDQIVAFLGTEQGRVLKVWDRSGGGPPLSESILVEEMNVYKHDKCSYNNADYQTIVSMELDKLSGALYVAFPNCVIKVPLGSCALYGRCKKACIASRDPYCVWVTGTGECKQLIPQNGEAYEQDLENGDVSGMEDCSPTF